MILSNLDRCILIEFERIKKRGYILRRTPKGWASYPCPFAHLVFLNVFPSEQQRKIAPATARDIERINKRNPFLLNTLWNHVRAIPEV